MMKYQILVVDDEPNVAFFFQQHLQLDNDAYEATAVNSGGEAIVALRKKSYDLVVTDLRMPGMNGLQLIRQIRKLSPSTKTILVTAFGSNAVWQEAEQLQIFRRYSKPVEISTLLEGVAQALKSKSAPTSGILAFTDNQFEQLAVRLEELRVDLGARLTILADTTGRILGYAGNKGEIDLDTTTALLGGHAATAGELTRQLAYSRPVHLSFFEGPPYDLYIASVGYNFFLTSVYDWHADTKGRIGSVWLYTRRAIADLYPILYQPQVDTEKPVNVDFASTVESQLDKLFAPKKPVAKNRIQQLLSRFQSATQIRINAELDELDESALPPPHYQLLFDTLNEVLKCSYQSRASAIVVQFRQTAQTVHTTVKINSMGVQPDGEVWLKLRKRFKRKNGTLNLDHSIINQTSVHINLPS